MKSQNFWFLLAAVGAAYLLLKKKDEAPATTPVVRVVEETLHQHEGEDNPIVHAFEEALEQKAKQGDAPA